MPAPVLIAAENARLITRTSADRAGIGDYVTKRDWRRDFDQDIRREGYDYFWPDFSDESNPGTQPFPNAPATNEPITFLHLSRRPNGEHAILAGTPTRLWRFFALEDGAYFEGTGATAYFEHDNEDPENPAAYFASASGDWLLIGQGFSPNGHRWEALDINGYTVLNNGVDLPMTYRIEEAAVVPIHELREQGIACVGTIGETNGILVCADSSEIHPDALAELMAFAGDIDPGSMTASQSGTTVTTPADYFTASHVGRYIVWEGGTDHKITAYNNPRSVTVSGSETVPNSNFTLRNKAYQIGAEFSNSVTASTVGVSKNVTASGSFFNGSHNLKTLRFANGFSSKIDTVVGPTSVVMHDLPDEAITGSLFWVSDADFASDTASADKVTSDSDIFTSAMLNRFIVFDSGETRQILRIIDSKNVKVDVDGAIPLSFFRIENPDSYAAFTDTSKMDRVRYRVFWSMPDEPRRFGSTVLGSIAAGDQTVTLQFAAKSFEAGQEIIVAGAGIDGGNITATILNVSELGRKLLLSETATTTATDEPVEQSDAYGSIVGYEDLQDDSSAILRVLSLGDVFVIYKETCIFEGFYTGSVENPFTFKRLKMPKSIALVYPWTLVDVGGQFHTYAGANSFYRFDLSGRVAQIIPELDLISDRFFSQVMLADANEIFAADNTISNEVWFVFPSALEDKALCFDYKQTSASTTSIEITAAASVKKPVTGTGGAEDLFVMGTSTGTVLTYGRVDAAQAAWGNAKEIFYRRSAYPFTVTTGDYESALESGWGDFGDPFSEKDLTSYVLYLASQSPDCGLTLTLLGARNPSDAGVQLILQLMQSPATENLLPTFFRRHYYKYRIEVAGKNNPCRVRGHNFEVELVQSRSHERRP